jgi:colanic acid/amylovoran biosynthesis glycosyltransferase
LDLEFICLKPDIIHFEFGSLAVGRTHLKELLNCKLSVSFRGYDLNFVGLDQPNYYQEVWEHADAFHFLGEDLWSRALRRGCPPEMPHKLIPPAIDLSRFPASENLVTQFAQAPGESIKILSVGRLEWKKGYEFALQAIKILKDQGIKCHYQIVGDGEYRDALTFARHQLKLEETVEFVGGLPHDQVVQALEKADIFLHSSVSEGFCNAVLEAQAMRLPVACTDADGLAENVDDGVTGFVVPRRDPKAMAAKLMLLSMGPSLRQSMGSAGRVRVESLFQFDQQLDAWESFYEGCV